MRIPLCHRFTLLITIRPITTRVSGSTPIGVQAGSRPRPGVGGNLLGFGADAAFHHWVQCFCLVISMISTTSTAIASTVSATGTTLAAGTIWGEILLQVVGDPLGGETIGHSGTAAPKAGTAFLEHRRDRAVLQFSLVEPAFRTALRQQVAPTQVGGRVLDSGI